jgi:negative regulator of sigma E activity
MRKATMDALLLTAFILLLLVFTGMLFTSPWLMLPIYALALLLTVGIRLRQVVRETTGASDQAQSFELGQMLYAGMAEPQQTAAYSREQSEEQAMELTSRAA